ncbi:MAG: NAD(P)H-dependent oxidoreductase subunit E [Clostridiaceae bacterium]|jgi:NADH-quinone oxidoreductase subunit E|nr:NAD(P)H-dependent oxidoreductase subunit E [Clostridiaceae bacterium]
MDTAMVLNHETLDRIIDDNGCKESSIIAILQAVQEHYRYLPQEAFPYIAKKLGIGQARLYSVATFYENFSLKQKGKYVIKICDGTACHVRKSVPILDRLRKELSLSEEKLTTEDLMFTVETVSCLGACGLAPVITINEKVHASMTPDKASELLNELRRAEACKD